MGQIAYYQDTFASRKGLKLFYQSWVPGQPKAAIVIIHGIGEHSARYTHVARHFSGLDYAVFAYDLRGNGRSSGKRGHVASFRDYLLDLRNLLKHLNRKEKLYILGHSLGGLIAIRFAMEHPETISGIIATSPALGISMKVPAWKKALAYGTQLIYPSFTLFDNTVPSTYLSHDPQICRAYDKDPLVHRLRTARFYAEFVRTCRKAFSEAKKLTTPSLFLQAGDDRIVSVDDVKIFYEKIPAKKKAIKVYPYFYHEILNEVEKEMVFEDIRTWLDSSIA